MIKQLTKLTFSCNAMYKHSAIKKEELYLIKTNYQKHCIKKDDLYLLLPPFTLT